MNSVVGQKQLDESWVRELKNFVSWSLLLVVFASASLATAYGQTIERNPAEIIIGPQVSSLPGEDNTLTSSSTDASPLGVDLTGITVVSHIDAVSTVRPSSPGIQVEAMSLLDTVQGRAVLAPFLDQPLSQKLIADIRIAITQYYRAHDRALVGVFVPPQEITSGVLQLMVIPFTAGSVAVEGNDWTSSDHILKTVRIRSGEELDSGRLTTDLNWLNLNPYREVAAVFEPGTKPGVTDLTLRARERRPWGVYMGYSNTGTPGTDRNRLFVGANVANLPFIDHQLSYQGTFSPNVISDEGNPFSGTGQPDYMSHSLSYFVPLRWRHKLNVQVSYVEDNQVPIVPFRIKKESIILYGDYGIPLPRYGDLLSEIYLGLEYDNQRSRTYFSNFDIFFSNIDVVQAIIGWRGQRNDRFGWTGVDLRGTLSPGDITSNNTDSAYVRSSGNPAASAEYAYVYGRLSRATHLFDTGLLLDTVATAQWANKALPGLQQFGVGGWGSVRGYETSEASGDDGFILSGELRGPQFSVLEDMNLPFEDAATVSGFWDFGYARNRFSDERHDLSSIGLGLDVALGNHLSASLAWGHALTDGPRTNAGDNRILGQLIVRY